MLGLGVLGAALFVFVVFFGLIFVVVVGLTILITVHHIFVSGLYELHNAEATIKSWFEQGGGLFRW